METNVGITERVVSGLAGGALVAAGLKRRSPLGLGMALAGAAVLARGATGHCAVYQAMGIDRSDSGTADQHRDNHTPVRPTHHHVPEATGKPTRARKRSVVDEASDESFPASDPPAFTPGKLG